MIKIADALTLHEASEQLPGNRAKSTLHRWQRIGIRGVKLETVLIGGRRYTSAAAICDSVAATTEAASAERRGCPSED